MLRDNLFLECFVFDPLRFVLGGVVLVFGNDTELVIGFVFKGFKVVLPGSEIKFVSGLC